MGETIRGGAYRGIDGKLRNANGEVLADTSDAEKWARDRQKAQLTQAEKESGRPVREIQAESEQRDERQAQMAQDAATATDPSTLGPVVMPDPKQATRNAEKSAEQEGVPGGKRSSAKK